MEIILGFGIDILRIILGLFIFLYGLVCLYCSINRQGAEIAFFNGILLILGIIVVGLVGSLFPTFKTKIMNLFHSDVSEVVFFFTMIFIATMVIAAISEMKIIPGLINGVSLIGLGGWISGLFSQVIIDVILGVIVQIVAIFFLPVFIIVCLIYLFFR